MSRLCLSVMTRVSSSFSVATYITLSRQRSLFEALLMSPQDFYVAIISVVKEEDSVATEILPYVFHYVAL